MPHVDVPAEAAQERRAGLHAGHGDVPVLVAAAEEDRRPGEAAAARDRRPRLVRGPNQAPEKPRAAPYAGRRPRHELERQAGALREAGNRDPVRRDAGRGRLRDQRRDHAQGRPEPGLVGGERREEALRIPGVPGRLRNEEGQTIDREDGREAGDVIGRAAAAVQQDRHGAGAGERRADDEDARRRRAGRRTARPSPYVRVPHVRTRRVKRDLDRLREPFDLLVIGAGIYGAAIAWDATLRGLRVALIDRGDIGGGTSFNNAKTLHGGVRSLQGLRLDELREYVRERRALLRIAPHLVRPLTFVSPALGTLTRNRLAFTAYFRAYDLLARDRNEGVDRALHLEGTRILGRDAYLALDPLSDPARVTGGVAWQDGQMLHGERVTLAFAKAAAAKGAVIATYLRADTALVDGGRVRGVRCIDVAPQPAVAPPGAAHERAVDVSARLVVNATGPQGDRVAAQLLGGAAAAPGAGPLARR